MSNTHYANTFVNALIESGLEAVCIAPGSRSTPLTVAFSRHPAGRIYRHLDERCAGFFALGLAMATKKPVALLCTSGTATANFFPAIIEAHMSQVPLIVLTADRPHELRHSGANQTIDQIKLFGDHVLWSVDAPLPDEQAPLVATRNITTLASRAVAISTGIRPGPVHINFPFRKPLEPVDSDQWIVDSKSPAANSQQPTANSHAPRTTHHAVGTLAPSQEQVDFLASLINQHERGIIVCGPNCPAGDFPTAVHQLATQAGYPIFADVLSNVRLGVSDQIVGGYETFLANGQTPFEPPDLVIRFGAVPTSKWLNTYLNNIEPAYRFHIRADGVWADDSHLTTHFWQCDETALCQIVAQQTFQVSETWKVSSPGRDTPYHQSVLQTEQKTWQAISASLAQANFDVAYVWDLLGTLPAGARLFLGNSLPVRHVDQFARPDMKPITLYGNRGASGIDGTTSCALGVSASSDQPLVLLVGDITFYHDLNGLLAHDQITAPVTIVLLNNNGGGIFRRLPITNYEPPFTDLFLTPHNLDFAPLVQGFGWHYHLATDRPNFRAHLAQAINDPKPTVIEVQTDGANDLAERARIMNYEG